MPVHHRDAGRGPMAGRPKNSDNDLRAVGFTLRPGSGAGDPEEAVFQNATNYWEHFRYLIH